MFESSDLSFRYEIRHPLYKELDSILESWWELVREQSIIDKRAEKNVSNIQKSKRFIDTLFERDYLLIAFDLDLDQIIGIGSTYPDNFFLSGGPSIWNIADVWVAKNKRRNGVAKNMVKELEKIAKKGGAQEIRLDVYAENESAYALYTSLGFGQLKETLNKKI